MAASQRPVTHLFTDLEGSTRLWECEPLRMQSALDRHDALARRVISGSGGQVVKTTGDGVHAVFDDPVDAVAAGGRFMLELAALAQEVALPLRARCGIHIGGAQARDGDYYGGAVNRAARIMGAAHGGQVLLSEAVAVLVRGRLPAEIRLRELGRVRLRDLAQPEGVYQLLHPGLDERFPPLRSLDSTPNNLPQQASSFVGRHAAIAELRELLHRHRLLTLAGPGGIGKTRLALQLAADVLDEYPDGVWFVELAPLSGVALVARTVAQVLGVAERPGVPIATAIAEFLAPRRALLILDNCEHVADACATLADTLLRGAAELRILATSREVLRVAGECLYQLQPLPVPPDDERGLDAVYHYPGVALFVDRAREQQPSFELNARNLAGVITICRELDGIPLALELAAARVRSLSIEHIAQRLSDRFRLLGSGTRTALPRHQTLAAMVDWSHQLLNDGERTLFECLAVFAGGFDLDGAQAVCGAASANGDDVVGTLMSLVDKSLVMALADSDRADVVADGSPFATTGEATQPARSLSNARDHPCVRVRPAGQLRLRCGDRAPPRRLFSRSRRACRRGNPRRQEALLVRAADGGTRQPARGDGVAERTGERHRWRAAIWRQARCVLALPGPCDGRPRLPARGAGAPGCSQLSARPCRRHAGGRHPREFPGG